MLNNFKTETWVNDILVDPLNKDKLTTEENWLKSSYGRKYPILNGIYDLRLLNNNVTKDQETWKTGQAHFESREKKVIDSEKDYLTNIKFLQDIYNEMPIEGDCLDVGGHQGRLRKFIYGNRYITCDPFLDCLSGIKEQPNLLKAYPFLLDPVNFICCDGEFLPFQSSFFQTVHMRSVIDHFLFPELALNEAYRVLRKDGKLIIGTFVTGITFSFIRTKRTILSSLGFKKYKDYHVWHPTFPELIKLILSCGFEIEKTIWQVNNKAVCYIQARKKIGLTTKR